MTQPPVGESSEALREALKRVAVALKEIGFQLHAPVGAYFILADHTPFGFPDDVSFCRHLVEKIGVAAIPPSAFYDDPCAGKPFVRFAFCKRQETLKAAVERLQALRRS